MDSESRTAGGFPIDVVVLVMAQCSVIDIQRWRRVCRRLRERLDDKSFWQLVVRNKVAVLPWRTSTTRVHETWPSSLGMLRREKFIATAIEMDRFLRAVYYISAQVQEAVPSAKIAVQRESDGAVLQFEVRGADSDVFLVPPSGNDVVADIFVAFAIVKSGGLIDPTPYLPGVNIVHTLEFDEEFLGHVDMYEHARFLEKFITPEVKARYQKVIDREIMWSNGIWLGQLGATDCRRHVLMLLYLMQLRGFRWIPPDTGIPRASPMNGRIGPNGDPEVCIATWNLRMLGSAGDGSRRLDLIAGFIRNVDVIVLQEILTADVLDKLMGYLPSQFVMSVVDRGEDRERYVVIYNTNVVTLVQQGQFGGTIATRFKRPPAVTTFKTRYGMDFSLLNIHVYYGKGKSDRRPEVEALADAIDGIRRANGKEENLILMGDFNLPPNDPAWDAVRRKGYVPLLTEPSKTTVGGVSLLDNIWMRRVDAKRYLRRWGFVPFDRGVARGTARREISDHRPVWATLRADMDEDEDDYGDLSQLGK